MEINLPVPAAPIARHEALTLVDAVRALLNPLMVEGAASLTHPANLAHDALAGVVRNLYDEEYPVSDALDAARYAVDYTMPRQFRGLAVYVLDVCKAIAE